MFKILLLIAVLWHLFSLQYFFFFFFLNWFRNTEHGKTWQVEYEKLQDAKEAFPYKCKWGKKEGL